jgi:hypothetical protein
MHKKWWVRLATHSFAKCIFSSNFPIEYCTDWKFSVNQWKELFMSIYTCIYSEWKGLHKTLWYDRLKLILCYSKRPIWEKHWVWPWPLQKYVNREVNRESHATMALTEFCCCLIGAPSEECLNTNQNWFIFNICIKWYEYLFFYKKISKKFGTID